MIGYNLVPARARSFALTMDNVFVIILLRVLRCRRRRTRLIYGWPITFTIKCVLLL